MRSQSDGRNGTTRLDCDRIDITIPFETRWAMAMQSICMAYSPRLNPPAHRLITERESDCRTNCSPYSRRQTQLTFPVAGTRGDRWNSDLTINTYPFICLDHVSQTEYQMSADLHIMRSTLTCKRSQRW